MISPGRLVRMAPAVTLVLLPVLLFAAWWAHVITRAGEGPGFSWFHLRNNARWTAVMVGVLYAVVTLVVIAVLYRTRVRGGATTASALLLPALGRLALLYVIAVPMGIAAAELYCLADERAFRPKLHNPGDQPMRALLLLVLGLTMTAPPLAAQVEMYESRPTFAEGVELGYDVWKDGDTWRVRWTTKGPMRHFTGSVTAEDGELESLKRIDVESGTKVLYPGRPARVVFSARTTDDIDGLDFKVDHKAAQLPLLVRLK